MGVYILVHDCILYILYKAKPIFTDEIQFVASFCVCVCVNK